MDPGQCVEIAANAEAGSKRRSHPLMPVSHSIFAAERAAPGISGGIPSIRRDAEQERCLSTPSARPALWDLRDKPMHPNSVYLGKCPWGKRS